MAAVETVFSADFAGVSVTPGDGDDLVWSPGSQAPLVALISSARLSVAVENEELSAPAIVGALAGYARRGVDVTVTLTASPSWAAAFAELCAAGAHVRTYHGETPLYIHAGGGGRRSTATASWAWWSAPRASCPRCGRPWLRISRPLRRLARSLHVSNILSMIPGWTRP